MKCDFRVKYHISKLIQKLNMRYLSFCLLLGITLNANGQRRTYQIGDTAFCGIVFYVEDSAGRQHGLVCALKDQAPKIFWYNGKYVTTGANKDKLFDKSNAETIIAVQGAAQNYAALICKSSKVIDSMCTNVDTTAWYLPSKAELKLMYKNLAFAKKVKFAKEGYWSSLEWKPDSLTARKNENKAWIVDFLNGKDFPVNKANKYYVRAVREFRN